jgi:hypothetical protein
VTFLKELTFAVILVFPLDRAFTFPVEDTVATLGLEDFQVTPLLRLTLVCVVPPKIAV